MTTNQLVVALSFPLFTAAAVALTALFVRRPWAERWETYADVAADDFIGADEVADTPLKATSPGRQEIEQFLREVAETTEHLLQSTETFRIRAHLVAEPAELSKHPTRK